ncbi:MAG TPA: sensor histidine kinase [Thermohalobaculum sp.]|nr:sensor histidine kinase [Thermohalobaculum sp.]
MALRRAFEAARRLRVQFALIVAIALAPAGLVAVFQAASNIDEALRLEQEALRRAARELTEDERSAIIAIRERIRLAARRPGIRTLGGEECDAAVAAIAEDDPRFSGALVFDDQGVSVCGESKGFDISGTEAFRSFSEAPRLLVGPIRSGRVSGRNVMLALAPVLGSDGRTGIVAMGLSADFFQRISDASDPSATQFALLDEAGTVFAGNVSERRAWLPLDVAPLLREEELLALLEAKDGKERMYYIEPLPIDRIWMIAARPALDWQGVLFSDKGLALIAPLLLWAIAVSVAFFVIDRLVSRHIVYLQRVAAAIGRGHLEIGALSLQGAPTEIRRLGDALENMAGRLAERESALRANVEAKRALLLEVHHRVKNNLQMISSLMNMQLRRVEGEAERRSVRIVQDRIHGLALVHQHLYATDQLDAVALDRLVEDIGNYLRGSVCPAGAAPAEVDFDLDPVTASADIATPVSLFLIEAMGNALKHCRDQTAPGRVFLSLKRDDHAFELSVRNDRPALDDGVIGESSFGLGTRLMEGFARQIGGSIERDLTDRRFKIVLRAPLAPRGSTFAIRRRRRDSPPAGSGGTASTVERAMPEDVVMPFRER